LFAEKRLVNHWKHATHHVLEVFEIRFLLVS